METRIKDAHVGNKHPVPPKIQQLHTELWEKAGEINTAAELYEYAEEFPSPAVGKILQQAISYFARKKVKPNGKRDGATAAFNSRRLGFGRRLVAQEPLVKKYKVPVRQVDTLWVGLSLWIEKTKDIPEFTRIERMNHKKDYGLEDPRALALLFITYITFQARGYPRPELPLN